MSSADPLSTQTFDGSRGPGFPYNIPRRTAPPHPPPKRPLDKGTPIFSAHEDGVLDGEIFNTTTNSVVQQQSDHPSRIDETNETTVPTQPKTNSIIPFTLRPGAPKTGRIIYRDPELRKSGYGFVDEKPLDVGIISRSEAAVLRKQLRQWVKDIKYRPAMAETRPFMKLYQAQFAGFFLGVFGFYYGSVYVKSMQHLPSKMKLFTAFLYGCIGSWAFKYHITPAVYVEMLQKNTPMGFKCRQFLEEYRRNTEGLENDNSFH